MQSFFRPAPTPRQAEHRRERAAAVPEFELEPPTEVVADIAADVLGIARVAVGRWRDASGREWYYVARPYRSCRWIDDCLRGIVDWRCIAVATTVDALIAAVEKLAARRELQRLWAA